MNKENFYLDRVDIKDGHEDYWFKTDCVSNKELTEQYMEMNMIGVPEVVYSRDENVVGIKRAFLFNYNVVISNDENLRVMLKELLDSNEA